LVAKSSGVARKLGRMMTRREIAKGYEAIVRGWPEWEELRVEAPLRRMGEIKESEIWVRQAVNEGGKASTTNFVVRERFENGEGEFAKIGCSPETGRTHQIRVHLEYAGFPIVGDKIYGGDQRAYLDFIEGGWTDALGGRLLLDRQALHASTLRFEWMGEEIRVECALSRELAAFCAS
jgi:23S rRNA pseudouridine1911/1915/1917 synthase